MAHDCEGAVIDATLSGHIYGLMFARAGLFLLVLAVSACAITPETAPGEQPSGQYRIDPEHASVHFRVRHLGLSYVVGRFDRFDAALDFDADHPERSRLTAMIEAGSVNTNAPRLDNTLRGGAWLAADSNPEIRFESGGIEITGDNEGVVSGALTLRGVTKPAEMAVIFYGGAPNLLEGGRRDIAFHGEMRIDRRDFGMTRFSDDVAGDAIIIEIEAEFLEGGK